MQREQVDALSADQQGLLRRATASLVRELPRQHRADEDWALDDPADHDLAGVRLIRDDIRTRVEALAVSLGKFA